MNNGDQPALQDTFEVEITDLEAPERASNALSARLGLMLLRWQRAEPRRRRWRGSSLMVCLTLLLLVILLAPSTGFTALLEAHWLLARVQQPLAVNNIQTARTSLNASNEILCPVETAWTPDSAFVALLGYTQPCTQETYIPAQVDLYSRASNGALLRPLAHWQPDEDILRALQHAPDVSPRTRALLSRKPFAGPRGQGSSPAIEYLQMLWSPDTMRLALSFVVVTSIKAYTGVFVANRDGKKAQILLHPEPAGYDPRQAAPLMWDLQHGQATPLTSLAPALAYTWDARDLLVPAMPLPAQTNLAAYANSPGGNPDGGRSFTIWQPGRPIILSFMHTPGAYLWSTRFAAWSPDGRYLVTNFSFSGLMEPPGQAVLPAKTLAALNAASFPRIPPHDPALIPSASSALTVAWNPANTRLAVYTLAGVVAIYNCQTGQLLRTLKPSQTHPLSGTTTLLNWSPDGRSLLLTSSQWGLITLWGTGDILR
ncbi:MAG TPA: hypothetical protein VFV38_49110 [Ktedonobacteraceae bacterium]|nr:hypothetical protein [Ktedonobacteraceae bacterium]